MFDFDESFDNQCEEYLDYLYATASIKYGNESDIDNLVQETMLAFIIKVRSGEIIKYPKAFLASTLHHKYNDMLRDKYNSRIVNCDYFEDISVDDDCDENAELRRKEYEDVRRELGRLIKIYREVTVRHYIYGKTVDEISKELGIAKGTVMSRLSKGRSQIKEGLQSMEKYSEISYAPKTVSLGIWGNAGLSREPFSLIRSPIEANILVLAYEKPISVREIAGTIGMPCAYIEPIVDTLVEGELLGRTNGGLVFTRCYMQNYEDAFGDIAAEESLADRSSEKIWKTAWKHLEPLSEREEFANMNEKQKATMILFAILQALTKCVLYSKPKVENDLKNPPERPNGGKWLATATVIKNGQRRNNIYELSGPVWVNYRADNEEKNTCQMFDCQSLFGDAHWAYANFKYKLSLHTILRFYASLLPCDVLPDNNMVYELVPEFEKLHIIRRDETGKAVLDIPALTFEEVNVWNPAITKITNELCELMNDDLKRMWLSRKNKIPKYVDCAEHFKHASALGAYSTAQLVSILKKGLMPYKAEIGKTPLIYIAYQKKKEADTSRK